MLVQNFHDQVADFYHKIYNRNYWCQEDIPKILRWEDQWPAMCYAHGIFDVPDLRSSVTTVLEQQHWLQQHRIRNPGHVLEIGSGQGEVSCTLSNMGYDVTTIDVNDNSERFHRLFAQKHFGHETADTHRFVIGDLAVARHRLDLGDIDTIVMVESIEHIFAHEWWQFFDHVLPIMQHNHAHLIITNLLNYWPLGLPGDCDEHISLIDDTFYDRLCEPGQQVLHRNRSHIVIAY